MTPLRTDPAVLDVDRRRGHAFAPPAELVIPELYATEHVDTADKLVILHYFCGPADWWIVEAEREGSVAFGFACLGNEQDAEWGYIELGELALIEFDGALITNGAGDLVRIIPPRFVERDLYWTPKPFRKVWPR